MAVVSGASASALTAAPVSLTFEPDLDVLAVLGARLNQEPSPRPRFGDDTWDLSCIADLPAYRNAGAARLDWGRIVDPVWRICAKEVGLGLLAPRVGLDRRLATARRRPMPAHVLGRHLGLWQAWFAWLAAHGVARLAQVNQAHCDAWLVGRLEEVGRPTVQAEVGALRCFADYRALLSVDAYPAGFYPWPGHSAAQVAGARREGENRTPVIPDEVFGPLLAASLFLVQVAGPDIVAARAEWRRLQVPAPRRSGLDQRLAQYLGDLATEGRRLPELHPVHLAHQRARGLFDDGDPLAPLNLRLVERHIGAYSGALGRGGRRDVVAAALAELGSGPAGWGPCPPPCPTPPTPPGAGPGTRASAPMTWRTWPTWC